MTKDILLLIFNIRIVYIDSIMDDTQTTQQDEDKIDDAEIVEESIDEVSPDDENSDAIHESSDDIEEETLVSSDQAPGAVTRMLELEQTIKTYYQSMQMKREELRKNKEMVSDAISQDASYEAQKQQVDEIKRKQNQLKAQVTNIPSILSAQNEMKGLSAEIKEMQKAMSKFLLEYRRLSNTNHIQVADGEFFEIVEEAKLVKAKDQQ